MRRLPEESIGKEMPQSKNSGRDTGLRAAYDFTIHREIMYFLTSAFGFT